MKPETTPLATINPLLNRILLIQNPSDNEVSKAITIEEIKSIIPDEFFIAEDWEGNLLFDNRPKDKRDCAVPTIVAHLDQVHDYERGFHLVTIGKDKDKIVAYNRDKRRCGTGGDDKCGIYVAIKMLLSDIPCRAIFTQDEEIGCVGARRVSATWGHESSILLQADRRGKNDLIMHTNGIMVADKELVARVLELPECSNMKPEYGTLTDIGDLCEAFDRSGFNISAGYYNAHMSDEFIILSELELCLTRVMAIARMIGDEIQNLPEEAYFSSYRKTYTPAYGGYRGDPWDDDDDGIWTSSGSLYSVMEGRSYFTNSGKHVGPMVAYRLSGEPIFMEETADDSETTYWHPDGSCSTGNEDDAIDITLV